MSKPGVILRDFRNEDYDNVIELWDEAGLPYRPQGRDSRKQIEKELKLGRSIFLVAETEGKVVGTILGTHDGRKGWLNRLAVAKEYRKKGLARKLVEEAERRLGELELEVIACLIEADNEASMKVFTRLGYEKWDGFYFSKRKSAGSVVPYENTQGRGLELVSKQLVCHSGGVPIASGQRRIWWWGGVVLFPHSEILRFAPE